MRTIIRISLFLLSFFSALYCQQTERGIVSDIDNNFYKTVVIGKFIWMAENLKTTKYNNGKVIPLVTGNSNWSGSNGPACCWYDDDKGNSSTYGALYNWYAVNTGNLCPDGWRVPSDEEWKYLEGYVDSIYKTGDPVWDRSGLRGSNSGNRLKVKDGWRAGMTGTDDFDFSALPGGERLTGFNNTKGSSGFWWSSTKNGQSNAWYRSIIYSLAEISRDSHPMRMGFSVRCIKNK